MKNKIKKYVESLNGRTSYSGNNRTMFVSVVSKNSIIERFGNSIPFDIIEQ